MGVKCFPADNLAQAGWPHCVPPEPPPAFPVEVELHTGTEKD